MQKKNKIKIIVICGPTGIGKTSVGIMLSKKYNGEIISADSVQIYKQMNICTAKPDDNELNEVTHHMINVVEPDEIFDAAMFAKMANKKIMELEKKKIVPFIVGGTGFYIHALLYSLFRQKPIDSKIIQKLNNEFESEGADVLYKKLMKSDPKSAKKIHKNDKFRVIRALEVFESTGKPISSHHFDHIKECPYNVLKIGFKMDREKLYDRINQRVDIMINEGLLDEVRGLINKGYHTGLKSMGSIGYKHMTDYINNNVKWDESIRLLKRDTRRYVKRQFTWFRKDKEIIWAEPDQTEKIFKLVSEFLK